MSTTKPHHCTVANAPKFLDWIRNRQGIAVWRSINLSNPGKSWSTPATIRRGDCEEPLKDGESADAIIPYPKPTWEADHQPERIVTSTDDVLVCHDKEVKRFHVAVRRSSNGLQMKCTDASTQRIRKAVAKAGKDAYYEFNYALQEAVIMAPSKTETLTEWAAKHPPEKPCNCDACQHGDGH